MRDEAAGGHVEGIVGDSAPVAAVGTPIALAIQRGGWRGHGRALGVVGVADLGVLTALQEDRGGAEVGSAS